MKKYVVTGASGLIGSHLLRLLDKEALVFAISRRSSGEQDATRNVRHVGLDLRRRTNFESLPQKVDAVIHLAQSEYFRDFPEHSQDVFEVNTVSTLRLLDYALKAGAKTFIYASSGGVYGYSDKGFTEDASTESPSELGFYFGSKLCSEILCDSYIQFMNVIILRFFFVYGPEQRKNMLITRLVDRVREGRPIVLQGKDGIRINPTYVSDAASAISHSLEIEGSHKINVAGPQVLSMREIGEIIGQVFSKRPTFDLKSDAEPLHLIGDITKMSRLLGPPVVGFKEGIETYLQETLR
jgi:nucleoside-diphosphate-sugar epimerase